MASPGEKGNIPFLDALRGRAALLHVAIERPGIRFGRFLQSRLERTAGAPA